MGKSEIDLGALEDETIESFQSDMKEIAKFIKLSRQGKKEFTFKGKEMGGTGRRKSKRYGACFQLSFGREDEVDLGSRNKPRPSRNQKTYLEILEWLLAHDRLDLSIQALKCTDIEGFKKRVLDHSI